MMLINSMAAIAAIAVEVVVWLYLSRKALEATWGDMRGGLLMTLAVTALVKNRNREEEARNWRPHVLVFTADVERNEALVRFAESLGLGRSVLTVATLLQGTLDEQPQSEQLAREADAFLSSRGITAFCEVDVVPDLESGMVTVAQANGIAGLSSNTVMLGWPDRARFLLPAMRVMRRLDHLGKCLIIARLLPIPAGPRRLLLWWSGREDNGDLMVLIAHLLTQNPRWRGAEITLCSIVGDEERAGVQRRAVKQLIHDSRIRAEAQVIVRAEDQTVKQIIHEHSQGASLVFMGLAVPKPGEEEAVAARVQALVEGLPSTILVRNAGPFRGQLI
jgi:hypothetical protein